jgi:hypothetical protein
MRWEEVESEVLTPVVMKSHIFLDITPCIQLKLWNSTDVSEEYIGCIFKVEEQAQQGSVSTCFHAAFQLGLFFNLEDGGVTVLWNVDWLSTDYMALCPIK